MFSMNGKLLDVRGLEREFFDIGRFYRMFVRGESSGKVVVLVSSLDGSHLLEERGDDRRRYYAIHESMIEKRSWAVLGHGEPRGFWVKTVTYLGSIREDYDQDFKDCLMAEIMEDFS